MNSSLLYYSFYFSKEIKKRRKYTALKLIAMVVFIALMLMVYNSQSQSLPSGFNQVLVANGISNPTVMAFAPDGRIFVAQQTGELRIIKNGSLLSQSFISLAVNSSGERGLLGIAFDPSFTTNNYIYLYYTLPSASNNRISRFTANNDIVVAGSEVVILDLDPLSSATNHNGGTMQFGPDGKLYIGVGENATTSNSQNLNSYLGKILRINKDGSVPSGNPYTSGSNQMKRVWSYGLRNPFTITFQPGTGRLFVNDVGQNAWEEIDEATSSGLNFGWPTAEGNSSVSGYTNPIYTYAHGSSSGQGCAITGGTFFNPTSTNYPASYNGKYFCIDYCGDWIDMLTLNGTSATRTSFATGIPGSPVSLITGSDGNLYYLSRDNSSVYKISYTTTQSPVITNQPQSLTVAQGNSATFSVSASGTSPLSYQWRKNGANISGANSNSYTISSVNSSHAGNYSVVVSNTAGSATSNNASLTVTQPNQVPNAAITSPASGATYAGGDLISYSGSASDPEDGTLPSSSYSWYVIFYHDTHTHPGPFAPSGVTGGTFTIPNSGETSANVFYRLFLVVTDSQGAKDTSYRDILPRTSTITLNTNPQGMQVTLDGQPFTTPLTVTSVEGIYRTISAASPQTFNGSTYNYSGWSQGGSQTQTFATPVNNVSYTATFNISTGTTITLNPVADAQVRGGSYAATNYGSTKNLSVKNTTSANEKYQTYLRFTISGLSSNQSSVKLRMYGHINNANIANITEQVFNVTSQTWSESSINYNNKPAAQSTVLASCIISGTALQYYEWDLTSFVNSQRSAGATSISLLVNNATTSNGSRVIFNSKESSSQKPQLKAVGPAPRELEPISAQEEKEVQTEMPFTFSTYPNPVKELLYIKFSGEISSGELQVYDLLGKKVYSLPVAHSTEMEINVNNFQDGIYIIALIGDNRKYTQRIVVRK